MWSAWVDTNRWRLAVVRHLEDLPRQYAALEHAMASFGTDFDLQQFKAAYNTSEDMDAYNRVQGLEGDLRRRPMGVRWSPQSRELDTGFGQLAHVVLHAPESSLDRGDPRAGHSSRLHRLIPGLDRAVPRGTRALTW
jgi:hypothetical protein